MKKISYAYLGIGVLIVLMFLGNQQTEAVMTKSKVEMMQSKVQRIHQQVENQIKTKVAEKKKEKVQQEQVTKVEEKDKKDAQPSVQETPTDNTATPTLPQPQEEADATSGASQSGRDIGERNRQYGDQLSDPNLSPAQRQEIIQEKKDFNKNAHGRGN